VTAGPPPDRISSQPLRGSRPLAAFAKENAPRRESNSGFTPSNRGVCARFKFRQLASVAVVHPKWHDTHIAQRDIVEPIKLAPSLGIQSRTTDSVDSANNAKPPVPDERFVASRPASSPVSRRPPQ